MIIITGVSGYIGAGLFKHYYSIDNSTIGVYNRHVPEVNHSENLFKLDITKYIDVQEFVSGVSKNLRNICLINCASITYDSFAHKSDPDQWKTVVDTNLTGTFNIIRALLPIMREKGYGRIINLSSVVAQKGSVGTSAYAASKAGLWGLSKAISVENANRNILINSINLGYMKSGMTDRIPEDIRNSILNDIPVHYFGEILEVILAVDHLMKSNYITGTTLDINGGLV